MSLTTKTCRVCSIKYFPKSPRQVTCGSKECITYYKNHSHRVTALSRKNKIKA